MPAVGLELEQVATGTSVVVTVAQDTVAQLFVEVGEAGVHEATGTLLELAVPHDVVVHEFTEVAGSVAHVCTGVGPVGLLLQVVDV